MSNETLGQRVGREWFSKAADAGGGRADLAPLVDREVEHLSMDLGNTKFQRDQFREKLAAMTEQRDEAVELLREWRSVGLLGQFPSVDSPWGIRVCTLLDSLDAPQDPAKAWAEDLEATMLSTDASQMSKSSDTQVAFPADERAAIPPGDGAQQAGEPDPSGEWRQAMGAAPSIPGDELPEDLIRRLRDGRPTGTVAQQAGQGGEAVSLPEMTEEERKQWRGITETDSTWAALALGRRIERRKLREDLSYLLPLIAPKLPDSHMRTLWTELVELARRWGREDGANAERRKRLAAEGPRIYLQDGGDADMYGDCEPPPLGGVTWCKDRINDSDSEWVRAPVQG